MMSGAFAEALKRLKTKGPVKVERKPLKAGDEEIGEVVEVEGELDPSELLSEIASDEDDEQPEESQHDAAEIARVLQEEYPDIYEKICAQLGGDDAADIEG